MTPAEIRDFRRRLTGWYRAHCRDLPWRHTRDPYRIWVSEVMLQQTQVNTVIPYYNRFLQRFPTIEALARARLRDLLKVWEGLGYYARIRNFHKAAQTVKNDYAGQVPDSWDDLIRLPGVGPYIAAAVLSIAHRRAHAVVDGNVKRVVARLVEDPTPVNAANAHAVFLAHVQPWLSPRRPDVFNQAMMELGALICTPSHPMCHGCPVRRHCRACTDDRQGRFPVKAKAVKTPTHAMVAVVVEKNGKVLLIQRPENGLLGGLWEFPGGRMAAGESAMAAGRRLLYETVGIVVRDLTSIAVVHHAYSHFKIAVTVLRGAFRSGRVTRNGPTAHSWVSAHQINAFPMHQAHRKILVQIR